MAAISKERIARLAVTIVLVLCAVFANFYTIRMMKKYGVELYFYDKLLVSCQAGGAKGIENEINRIIVDGRFPREIALAKKFGKDIEEVKDPEKFLSDVVSQKENAMKFLDLSRSVTVIIMIIIILWRIVANRKTKKEDRLQAKSDKIVK